MHRLGAGINFEDWRKARPGDFMKIFWTDRIGRRESGHLTVLVKDGGDQVTFWSSNIPDGYGARTVPKSRIRRVIFTTGNGQGFCMPECLRTSFMPTSCRSREDSHG